MKVYDFFKDSHLNASYFAIGTVRGKSNQTATKSGDVKETKFCLSQEDEDHIPVSRGSVHWW